MRLGSEVTEILTRDGRVAGLAGQGRLARALRHRREQRRRRPHLSPSSSPDEPRAEAARAATRGNALQHVAVPHLLRDAAAPSAPRPSQRPLRPPLPRAARPTSSTGESSPTTSPSTSTPRRSPTPRMAPPGCEAFYVLAPVPHLGKAPIDWEVEGPRYADRILDYLEARYLPGLRQDLVTPPHLHAARLRARASLPSWVRLLPGARAHPERLFSRRTTATTAIPGLYFVGAGTHPGAGIPGVVSLCQGDGRIDPRGHADGERAYVTMSPQDDVLDRCRVIIRDGSKSFAQAACLFDRETRAAAFLLYAWCRHCDDQIDGEHLGYKDAGRGLRDRGDRLGSSLRRDASVLRGERLEDPVFAALQRVVTTYEIPERYPLELLEGFAMDVEGRRHSSLEDLFLYCYHVAGTVGLMMAHIMGARDEWTLRRAADLGIALQMTNIARDVDRRRAIGKGVPAPLRGWSEAGIARRGGRRAEAPAGTDRWSSRLLAEADRFYAFGATRPQPAAVPFGLGRGGGPRRLPRDRRDGSPAGRSGLGRASHRAEASQARASRPRAPGRLLHVERGPPQGRPPPRRSLDEGTEPRLAVLQAPCDLRAQRKPKETAPSLSTVLWWTRCALTSRCM